MDNELKDTVTTGNPLIDYSAIPGPEMTGPDEWETPPRKYFGPKLPNGKLAPEKPYIYQPYPSVRYAQPGGPGTRIVTKMVHSKEEDATLGSSWKHAAADFGFIGAPSVEQHLKLTGSPVHSMMAEQAEKDAEEMRISAEAERAEAEQKVADQRAADEAALQAKIAEGVKQALAAMGIQPPAQVAQTQAAGQTLHVKK